MINPLGTAKALTKQDEAVIIQKRALRQAVRPVALSTFASYVCRHLPGWRYRFIPGAMENLRIGIVRLPDMAPSPASFQRRSEQIKYSNKWRFV